MGALTCVAALWCCSCGGIGGKWDEAAGGVLAACAPVAVKRVHVEVEGGGGGAVGLDVGHEALGVGPRGAGASGAGESVLVCGCNPGGDADVADLLRGRVVPRAGEAGAGAHGVLHAENGARFAGRLRGAGGADCRGGGVFAA